MKQIPSRMETVISPRRQDAKLGIEFHLCAFASLMKMQLVTATLPHENKGKNPPVLRPAPFAKGGQWGISRRCSNHGTSFSCAVLYRLVHELLGGRYPDWTENSYET
jgi:hypothetical protein